MSHLPDIYRKRYDPEELIHLKDDKIIALERDYMITQWNSLKPRKDISTGISAYFIKDGVKVSKVFREDSSLVYWYCDIIRTEYDETRNSYTFIDLLIDVLVYENGMVKVVDLNELADMISEDKVTKEEVITALSAANTLLQKIYDGSFSEYQNIINQAEASL